MWICRNNERRRNKLQAREVDRGEAGACAHECSRRVWRRKQWEREKRNCVLRTTERGGVGKDRIQCAARGRRKGREGRAGESHMTQAQRRCGEINTLLKKAN